MKDPDRQGKRLTDLYELDSYAKQRRSVICPTSPCFNKPIPVAVILSMQARVVLRLFHRGMYLYEKKPKASFADAVNPNPTYSIDEGQTNA